MRSSILLAATLVTAAVALPHAAAPAKRSVKRDQVTGLYEHLDPEKFVVAAVHASPYPAEINVFSATANLTWTIQRSVEIIEEAAEDGVGLLAFPETYFPGYPFILTSNPAEAIHYFNQSLEVGSPEWDTIVAAVKAAGIYVAFGASERQGENIFMAQFLLDPEGEVLIHRHKLRPSGGERNLWSDGKLHDFKVVPTPYGRIGMLECWEHFHPAMTFPMQAQLEDIHIGAFPEVGDLSLSDDTTDLVPVDHANVNMASLRVYAATSQVTVVAPAIDGAYIFNTAGVVAANATSLDPNAYASLSLNTTAFLNKTYDINGQFGWGVLMEMLESYPSYIPRQKGTFVDYKAVSFDELEAIAKANTSFFSPNPYAAENPVYHVEPN